MLFDDFEVFDGRILEASFDATELLETHAGFSGFNADAKKNIDPSVAFAWESYSQSLKGLVGELEGNRTTLRRLLSRDNSIAYLLGDAKTMAADAIAHKIATEIIQSNREEIIALVSPHITQDDKEDYMETYGADVEEFDQMDFINTSLAFYIADKFLLKKDD